MVQAHPPKPQTLQTHPSIARALIHLASCCDGAHTQDGIGFNKLDRDFGHSLAEVVRSGDQLSFNQQNAAIKLLRKYKKQLNKAGIELPRQPELTAYLKQHEDFEVVPLGDDEYEVRNTLKGSTYTVTAIGDALQCSCLKFSHMGSCKHADAVVPFLPPMDEYEAEHEPAIDPVDWFAGAGDIAPNVIAEPDDNWIDDSDPRLALMEVMGAFEDEWEEVVPEGAIVPSAPRADQNILDGIELTAGQLQALSEMARWIDSNEKFYLLSGFSGTGKTTVLQAFLTLLRQYGDRRPVVLSATTNKAVKVVARMAEKWNLAIDSYTVHKLLGLKPRKREKRIVFEPDPKEVSRIEQYGLVIIDESSMLNQELFYEVDRACGLNRKVLFVGDEYQAPPIGETKAKPFSLPQRSTLSEIVRYGGSIADLAESIRCTIDPAAELPVITSAEGAIAVLENKAWEYMLIKRFKGDEYRDNPDFVRAIAYSNRRVDALNQKVREALYGLDAPQFLVGERLICHEAYSRDESVVIPTSEEGEIVSAVPGTVGQWAVWYLQLKLDGGEIVTVPTLQQDERDRFSARLKELGDARRWAEYWDLKEAFAELRYPYAITAHKSQGSTYQHVFVDVANFTSTFRWLMNDKPDGYQEQKRRERNQLLYVAVTRAAKSLAIVR